MRNEIIELANLIKSAKHVVVLTGAGMDTESNIPDFRSENGWWKNIDPREVANIDTFYENYSLFHEFYSMRFKLLESCKPHEGHYILAELEEKGLIHTILTQNVSRLHAIAGSKKIHELHGNIRIFRCNHCNHPADPIEYLEKKNCKHCGKKALRPNVTLFGEILPRDAWDQTIIEVEKSDVFIVIGTSLEVSPVNQIPKLAKGKIVYINDEIGEKGYDFDLVVKGKAKKVLRELQVSK